MLNPAVSNLIKEMKKACPFCGGSAHLWSCERSLISTIEFWQPAVDGKSAVEKVKADIRAERGV